MRFRGLFWPSVEISCCGSCGLYDSRNAAPKPSMEACNFWMEKLEAADFGFLRARPTSLVFRLHIPSRQYCRQRRSSR